MTPSPAITVCREMAKRLTAAWPRSLTIEITPHQNHNNLWLLVPGFVTRAACRAE